MRPNRESEKYFNRGENRTHNLDVTILVVGDFTVCINKFLINNYNKNKQL